MNNTDFRQFLLETSNRPQNEIPSSTKSNIGRASLGTRQRHHVQMKPRAVRNEPTIKLPRHSVEEPIASNQRTKKASHSTVPKGSILPAGYHDRTQDRGTRDEKQERIRALEEQMKLGQIDKLTFEKMRDAIVGGDVESTHLIKGLDRRLLERVRKGENVYSEGHSDENPKHISNLAGQDSDYDLDNVESGDIKPIARERREKRGELAPAPNPMAGVKRSRDSILAELRASREATSKSQSETKNTLGTKFRKVGDKPKYPRTEYDARGREVLIILDENGREKRKVRKVAKTVDSQQKLGELLMPEKNARPLDSDVSQAQVVLQPQPEDSDEDIFQGVGDAYNPLDVASEDENDSESNSDAPSWHLKTNEIGSNKQVGALSKEERSPEETAPSKSQTNLTPAQLTKPGNDPVHRKNNYFNEKEPVAGAEKSSNSALLSDPTIVAALRHATALESKKTKNEERDQNSTSTAAQRMLHSQRDRDYDDVDMGFGTSWAGDEAEADDETGGKVKLSQWKGLDGDDDGEHGSNERAGKQRKRGKKQRKGDKDSMADVMKVIEGRKKK